MTFIEELKKDFESVNMDARMAASQEGRISQCSRAETAIFWKFMRTLAEGKLSKDQMVEASKLMTENLRYI